MGNGVHRLEMKNKGDKPNGSGVIGRILRTVGGGSFEKLNTYLEQGRIELESGDYVKALEYFDKAVDSCKEKKILVRSPPLDLAYAYKGKALAGLGKLDDAFKYFDLAIESNPRSAFVWYAKGLSLQEQGAYEKALKHYDKALIMNPEYEEVLMSKSGIYSSLKDNNKMLECLQQVLKINPSNKTARKIVDESESEAKRKDSERWVKGLLKRP